MIAQVVESKTTRQLVKQKAQMISFVELNRANIISIVLSGIKAPYARIKVRPINISSPNCSVAICISSFYLLGFFSTTIVTIGQAIVQLTYHWCCHCICHMIKTESCSQGEIMA